MDLLEYVLRHCTFTALLSVYNYQSMKVTHRLWGHAPPWHKIIIMNNNNLLKSLRIFPRFRFSGYFYSPFAIFSRYLVLCVRLGFYANFDKDTHVKLRLSHALPTMHCFLCFEIITWGENQKLNIHHYVPTFATCFALLVRTQPVYCHKVSIANHAVYSMKGY